MGIKDMEQIVGKVPIFKRWLWEVAIWRIDAATNDGQVDVHEFVQFFLKFKDRLEIKQVAKAARKKNEHLEF